jgi:hypothetical protein
MSVSGWRLSCGAGIRYACIPHTLRMHTAYACIPHTLRMHTAYVRMEAELWSRYTLRMHTAYATVRCTAHMCVMSAYTLELWRIWRMWRAVLGGTARRYACIPHTLRVHTHTLRCIWRMWRAVLAGTCHSCAHFRRQGIYLACVLTLTMLNMPNTSISVLILLYMCPQLGGSPRRYHLCAHSRRPAGAHFFPPFHFFIFFNVWIPALHPADAHFLSLHLFHFSLFFSIFFNAWIPAL